MKLDSYTNNKKDVDAKLDCLEIIDFDKVLAQSLEGVEGQLTLTQEEKAVIKRLSEDAKQNITKANLLHSHTNQKY